MLPARSSPSYLEPDKMPRPPKVRKPKQEPLQQQSPFLNLPPEIRNFIYRHTLISPSPIDLWPHLFHTDLSDNPEWVARTSAWSEKTLDELPFKTRNQASLTYVRKEMATGLLGTCRQVYNEGVMYFWAENLFRFSGRSGWQGLLRFFLTIGPVARARIRRLEVHAPIYMRWPDKKGDERDLNGHSKNFPKMHMVKIPPEGHLDRAAAQRVCNIMAKDRTLEEINFIIPNDLRNGDEGEYGGYGDDHDAGIDAYDRLGKISTLDFLKKTVVVEKGGYLAVERGPEQIMDNGWDLVCLPGSAIYERKEGGAADEYEKHEVTETRTWRSPAREWDYLLGVNTLFQEPETVVEHANGGKHMNSLPTLWRDLKGFGGCKFVVQDGAIRPVSIWAPSRREWDYLLGVPQLFQEDAKVVESPKRERRGKGGREPRVHKKLAGMAGYRIESEKGSTFRLTE